MTENEPASFGDLQEQGVTFGDMAGTPREEQAAPDPNRRVVGAVCICEPHVVGTPTSNEGDPACPQHGRGPQTPDELARVSAALARATEAGEVQAGRFVDGVGPETAEAGTTQNFEFERPDQQPPREVLEEMASQTLQEASPDQLQGQVTVLRDDLLSKIVTAAQRHANGERCAVDVILTPVPDPGTGQTILGAMIFHKIPGMILDQPIQNAMLVTGVLEWTPAWCDAQMRDMWRVAREQRSQQPEQMRAHQRNAQNALAAMGNGHTPPGGGSGLIVPGQGFPGF